MRPRPSDDPVMNTRAIAASPLSNLNKPGHAASLATILSHDNSPVVDEGGTSGSTANDRILAGRLAHLGAFVRFEGSLDMRMRVLAAMTVAREVQAVYVWGRRPAAPSALRAGGD
jgi:hypothetical protein